MEAAVPSLVNAQVDVALQVKQVGQGLGLGDSKVVPGDQAEPPAPSQQVADMLNNAPDPALAALARSRLARYWVGPMSRRGEEPSEESKKAGRTFLSGLAPPLFLLEHVVLDNTIQDKLFIRKLYDLSLVCRLSLGSQELDHIPFHYI